MNIYFQKIKKIILALDKDNLVDKIRRGSRKQKKNILLVCIFVFSAKILFSAEFHKARADVEEINLSDAVEISQEMIDPMNRIRGYKVKIRRENPENICSKKIEKNPSDLNLEKVRMLVSGYPIETMLPYIEKRDKKTAYFLIAIAKKESDWGKHAPSKKGRDCFNYWGYKGNYNLSMGYSCFDSPEQAIQVVGDRIKNLVERRIDTPSRMVVWKCGSSCAGHDAAGVKKWIYDVDLYYRKMEG